MIKCKTVNMFEVFFSLVQGSILLKTYLYSLIAAHDFASFLAGGTLSRQTSLQREYANYENGLLLMISAHELLTHTVISSGNDFVSLFSCVFWEFFNVYTDIIRKAVFCKKLHIF